MKASVLSRWTIESDVMRATTDPIYLQDKIFYDIQNAIVDLDEQPGPEWAVRLELMVIYADD